MRIQSVLSGERRIWTHPCFSLRCSVVAISGPERRVSDPKTGKCLEKWTDPLCRSGQPGRYGSTQCAASHSRYSRQKKDFVLLSCHYDTWYRGAFDNCTANALALELVRYFQDRKEQLAYSLKLPGGRGIPMDGIWVQPGTVITTGMNYMKTVLPM